MYAIDFGLGERWQGLPVSAEAVLRFERDRGRDEGAATLRLVRLAFPLSWRRLWGRDIARRVSVHPLRALLLAGFLSPEVVAVADEVVDENERRWRELERAQQVDEGPGQAIPFPVICRQVELAYGARWWHDPERWGTRDGFAPYDVVWEAWKGWKQQRAWQRLDLIRAIAITRMGQAGQARIDDDVREAMGG